MKKLLKQRPSVSTWLGLLVVAIAIANELRKPTQARTWHDRLFGFVPYDLRFPTWERLKLAVWNTQSDSLLVPQAFGVGWNVNLRGVLKRVGLVGSR